MTKQVDIDIYYDLGGKMEVNNIDDEDGHGVDHDYGDGRECSGRTLRRRQEFSGQKG